MEQVLDILGEPVRVSYKEPYEAWLYEFKYVDRSRPKRSPSDRVFTEDSRCLHAIVWLEHFEVMAVTGATSDRATYCGSGAIPIDWNDMPKSGE